MTARFSVGGVLATSVRIWARNLPRFMAITVLCYLPVIGWELAMVYQVDPFLGLYRGYDDFLSLLHPVLRVLPGGRFVAHACMAAAVTQGTLVALTSKPAPIVRGLQAAVRRFFPVMGVALIVWVASGGVMTALNLLVGRWENVNLFIFGSAVYYAVAISLFYLAVPIATVERRAVIGSIAHGFALARGARIRVFAIALVWQFAFGAVYVLVELALTRGPGAKFGVYLFDTQLFGLVVLGTQAVLSSFQLVSAAVTYRLLRNDKEGPPADELVTVFE